MAFLLVSSTAGAGGSPNIGLSENAPATVLYGTQATITLAASNPISQPYGYNLSYRAILPDGVSYVSGSSSIEVDPTVIADQPALGESTLVWSNVSDLSPGSSYDLSFKVSHSALLFSIGDSFTTTSSAYINSDPRYVPQFSATGAPSVYTGSATSTGSTVVSAIDISQAAPGKILRGVHDHQVTYTITVTNNSVNPTTSGVVDEYLPAGIEFLGCGGAGLDKTTDSPTNPGTTFEYPGSGAIEASALGGCVTPTSVATLTTSPGSLPNGVYTHVTWDISTLAPGASTQLKFLAAVPVRNNTVTWPGGAPSGLDQVANLDNNSGSETTDGQTMYSYGVVTGQYDGITPVVANDTISPVAKDIILSKSADSGALRQGQITHWTLTARSSEYRYNDDLVVSDTLPNGFCPLAATNLTASSQPSDSECDPTGDLPSSDYAEATQLSDGTWALDWHSSTDPALTRLEPSTSTTITYATRTRVSYQSNFADSSPILAGDSISNGAFVTALANVICNDKTDCTPPGSTMISHSRPTPERIFDSAYAGQSAAQPVISKKVATSSSDCIHDTYTTSTPTYHPGDLVCWEVAVDFPSAVNTQTQTIDDFLPLASTFDNSFNFGLGDAALPSDTLIGITLDSSATTPAPGSISWVPSDSRPVEAGNQVFNHVYATYVGLPTSAAPGELVGNLFKFSNTNTFGTSYPQRSQADFELDFPQLTLTKEITAINGGSITPTHTVTVTGGDTATTSITLSNAGAVTADSVEVWDNLPAGLSCGDISTISDGGSCTSDQITWGATSPVPQDEVVVPASGNKTLTFITTVPSTVDPANVFTDHAGVRDYSSETNTGGSFYYVPADNIDPFITVQFPDGPNTTSADDSATLETPDVTITKSHTSAISTTGNTSAQATIGEIISFTVEVRVPAGTTLSGTASITDPIILPVRLAYVSGSESATLNGGAATGFTIDDSSGTPTLTFPTDFAVSPSGSDAVVRMNFQAYKTNTVQNTAGSSLLNIGHIGWTDPRLGAQTRRSANDVIQTVEPQIILTESNNSGGPVHGGQLVTYTLNLKDTLGVAPAYDNVVVETVPSGLTATNSSGVALTDGASTADGGVYNAAAHTITWNLATLASNTTQSYHYNVTVNSPPVAGATLTDSATATTTSLPGSDPLERTTGTSYISTTSSPLTVNGDVITKSVDSATATIGHQLTYTLLVTLPANVTSYDNTVIDVLPDTIDFDSYVSATCVTNCPPEATPTISEYTPTINGTNGKTSLAWDFGDLTPTTNARTIELIYLAHVRDTHRSGGAAIVRGNVLTNSATASWNETNKVGSFDAATIPSGFDHSNGPVTRNVTVIEPTLTATKTQEVNDGSYTADTVTVTDGDSLSYLVTVHNSGNSPAYDVAVRDTVPSELTDVTATQNSGYITHAWTSGDHNMTWQIPGPIAAGGTVVLGYQGSLVPATSLHNNDAIDNRANISSYYGVSSVERSTNGFAYHLYLSSGSNSVMAWVRLPVISIVETTGAAGFPDSSPAEVNQPFTWRVVVTDTSADVGVYNLHLTSTLPANWSYIPNSSDFSAGGAVEPTVSGQDLIYSTSIHLNAGQSTVLTYRAKPTLAAKTTPGIGPSHPNIDISSAAVEDSIGSTADADGPFAAGPVQAEGILQIPVLNITKTPSQASLPAGAEDSYDIAITNSGLGSARNLVIEDTLPTGMSYVPGQATASPSSGFSETSASGDSISWAITILGPGDTVHITVPVATDPALDALTELTNDVEVSSDEAPTTVETSGTITLNTEASLRVSKSADPNPAVPGENLTYTIGVKNNGPSVARDVVLTDALPANVTFISTDADCSFSLGTVTCDAGDLDVSEAANYDIVVSLSPSNTANADNAVAASTTTPNTGDDEATVIVSMASHADLIIAKTTDESPVYDGENAAFTIHVTNNGPSDVPAVVTDVLPSSLTFVSSDSGCSAVAQTVTCDLGTIASDSVTTIHMQVRASSPGDYTNTATVSTTAADTDYSNNSDSSSLTVSPSADVSLTKTAADTTVADGEITYTLTATNNGPDAANNVTVTDPLPSGTIFVSTDGTCDSSTSVISCDLGTLAKNASVTIHIVVSAPSALADQTITNTASVSADEHDPDLSNNDDSASTIVGHSADISITKTVASPANAGENIPWTFVVTNHGPSTAHNVVVADVLPGGTDFVSADSRCTLQADRALNGKDENTVTCDLGTMASGASITLGLVTTDPLSLTGETITNGASVSADEYDPGMSNNEDSADVLIIPAADLAIAKTGPASVVAGSSIPWTLAVVNHGLSPAHNVTVSDVLPKGTIYQSASTDKGSCTFTASTSTLVCAIGTLADAEGAQITLLATAPTAAGSIVNTATVTGDELDTNLLNNTSSSPTALTAIPLPNADLTLTKVLQGHLYYHQKATYVLTVTNGGPATAINAVARDVMPLGLHPLSAHARQGSCTILDQTVTCALGNLADGAVDAVTVQAMVVRTGTIQNIATATADTPTTAPSAGVAGAVASVKTHPARLALRKVALTRKIFAGGKIRYHIKVSNIGTTTAWDLVVCDFIPRQTTVVARGGGSLTNGHVCYKLAKLTPKHSHVFTIVLRADASARGRITNRASVRGTNVKRRVSAATSAVRARAESGGNAHPTG